MTTINANNLVYPILEATPSFGDGMRVYVDGVWSSALQKFHQDNQLTVRVNWGPAKKPNNKSMELTIHGLNRKPAYALITSTFNDSVTWSYHKYPEYLATLILRDNNDEVILRRTLHVMPPVMKLKYRCRDVLFLPNTLNDTSNAVKQHDSQNDELSRNGNITSSRRRGFGIELETVQLPPNAGEGRFTARDELNFLLSSKENICQWDVDYDPEVKNAAPHARLDLWRKYSSKNYDDIDDEIRALILGGTCLSEEIEQILPQSVQHIHHCAPEYKSPKPPHELYHEFPIDHSHNVAERELTWFLQDTLQNNFNSRPMLLPTISDIGQSASSIHVHVNITNPLAWPHPKPSSIDRSVKLTQHLLGIVLQWIRFDTVIQLFCQPWMRRDRSFAPMYATGPEWSHSEVAWTQGTAIHDKVLDMYNVPAFFRHVYETYMTRIDQDEKQKQPNADETRRILEPKKQDNAFQILDETEATTSVTTSDEEEDILSEEEGDESYSLRLFHNSISMDSNKVKNIDHKENVAETNSAADKTIFDAVFDDDKIRKTLYRKCSLNLMALKKYGTIEFRRMHATLDVQFITAWTRFCAGFCEIDWDSRKYLEDAGSWQIGLERLIHDQNHATLEELMQLMTRNSALGPSDVQVLMDIVDLYSDESNADNNNASKRL